MADDLKEKVLIFEEKNEKPYKDKKLWELLTDGGGKFTVWDAGLAAAIVIGQEVKVKYEIKKTEKYTNLTIKAVANQKEDGSWGEWLEEKKGGGKGGFKAFDGESANKRQCLSAAAAIVSAQMAKTTVANPLASVIDLTAKLMAGVFGAAKAPEVKVGAGTVVKKATVVDAEFSDAEPEEVPF